MPIMKSEYACPACKATTGQSSQIVANGGELLCSVNGSHRWPDVVSFKACFPDGKPIMEFKVVATAALPQQNHAPMTVSVPISVKNAVEEKYGGQAGATVASILQMMVEGDTLVIGQGDLERFKERLGKKPESPSELFGLVYAMGLQLDEAKQERDRAVEDVKAYENMAPGRVVVDLGGQFESARERAKSAGLPLKLWVEQNLLSALEQNWF